jgi:hypothetical protein
MLETTHVLILGAVAVLGLIVFQSLKLQHDSREPPFLPSKIPVIGHLLGMMFQGLPYWHKTAYVIRSSFEADPSGQDEWID